MKINLKFQTQLNKLNRLSQTGVGLHVTSLFYATLVIFWSWLI